MSGWIDFRCTICGELRRQPLEPLGHEVVNGICVRCGEVMQLPFRDVPEDAYYYDAVVWGLSRGVVNGTTMTTFSPDLSCTRAQAVAFLWRAAGDRNPPAIRPLPMSRRTATMPRPLPGRRRTTLRTARAAAASARMPRARAHRSSRSCGVRQGSRSLPAVRPLRTSPPGAVCRGRCLGGERTTLRTARAAAASARMTCAPARRSSRCCTGS